MAGLSRGRSWALAVFAALFIVLGAGNLGSSYLQYRHFTTTQQQQGQAVEAKLCATFASLGAIPPPPGPAASNPSRAYDQALSAKLQELGTDIGCR